MTNAIPLSNRPVGQHKYSNAWIHILMMAGVILCIVPFILVVIISFTDEKAIARNGYTFFPEQWSLNAYRYLLADSSSIVRAYGITIFVTVVSTLVSLFIGTMISYVISRKDYPYGRPLAFFIFFTMLFNGGLVPTYLVYTTIFHMKDTIFALIVPGLLLNAFNVMIMRTFFSSSVPVSLIESAYLDGADEFRIYIQIVLPLARPVVAAIGFMVMLSYWNDWFNSLVYINNAKIVSLQYLMSKVLMNIQALKAASNISPEMQKMLGDMPSESTRMAMAVIGIGPMLFSFPFFQKYFISGLTIGAVKG